MKRRNVYLLRTLVLAVFLLGWQYLPQVQFFSKRVHFLNPFFISSPSSVARTVYTFAVYNGRSPTIWPYLGTTITATLIGFAIGLFLGFTVGLIFSNAPRLNEVMTVFIMAGNSVPRIALVPVIILVAGIGIAASVLSAVIVVFFLTFFNAFEGGRRVPIAVLNNARVMGATPRRVMLNVRLPYVVLWTFAVVPNALAFSLISVVTTEILAGTGGIGILLISATSNLNASVTFAIVVYLSVTGVALLQGAKMLKQRVLAWAEEQ